MTRVTVDEAMDCVDRGLQRLGTPDDVSRQVAGWLLRADQSGHPSHGIIRLIDYTNRCNAGELIPTGRPTVVQGEHEGPTICVDGGHGYGLLAADLLIDEMVERAHDAPVVMGGIVNASHSGRLGEWVGKGADAGLITMMMTASLAKTNVAGFGAREGKLGTNPLACAVPAADGRHFMLDFATSMIAGGKIQHLIAVGGQVPPGSLLDVNGNASTDPADWLKGGVLTTFGAHKGYALSLLVSLLSGCLVGAADPTSTFGVFALTIDPGAFAPDDDVRQRVQTQLERMRETEPRPGFTNVEVPGDFERRNREEAAFEVDIADDTWVRVQDLAYCSV